MSFAAGEGIHVSRQRGFRLRCFLERKSLVPRFNSFSAARRRHVVLTMGSNL